MTTLAPPSPDRKLTPVRGFISVFLAVFLVVFLGDALIIYLLPETYTATARVLTNTPGQVAYLGSEQALLKAADELDLRKTLSAQYAEKEPLSDARLLQTLRRTVQIRQVPGSEVTEIRADSRTGEGAAALANAVARAGTRGTEDSPPARRAHGDPIRIIDLAVAPGRPSRPNKPLNFVLSAFVGIVLGAFAGGVGARLAVGVDREAGRRTEPPT